MAKGKRKDKDKDKDRDRGSGEPAPKTSGRAKKPQPPSVDPNLPRPDGPRVSNRGGLVFVAVILGLIGLAIGVQFLSQ